MYRLYDFVGELMGTFILVLFGCGSIAVTVLFSSHVGLFQVAAVWGVGLSLAIYTTRHLSCAHLNPAVSIAMVVGRRMSPIRLPIYLAAQLLGAFCAALVIYGLFAGAITQFEQELSIIRGTPESVKTAMIFGEFYPNPGLEMSLNVSTLNAFFAEAIGTFMLVLIILALTEGCNLGRPDDRLVPLFIGLTLTVIISIIAPLTQAGLNPARDFSPRLFAYFTGWGAAAFPAQPHGFFTVYILGPISGSVIASFLFSRFIEPLMIKKNQQDIDQCDVNKCGE